MHGDLAFGQLAVFVQAYLVPSAQSEPIELNANAYALRGFAGYVAIAA